MKKIMWIAAILTTLQGTAFAAPSRGQFGAGVMVGDPVGLSARYWLASDRALQFGLGDDDGILAFASHVWHVPLVSRAKGPQPYMGYFGIGGQVADDDGTNETEVGVRPSAGINYWAAPAVELFVELSPVLWLTKGDHMDLGGGVGVRFYFLEAANTKRR